MKFKFSPVYIYLGVIIIAAAVIILITETGNEPSPAPVTSGQSTMPEDDIHKGLGDKGAAPGAANVQKEIVNTLDSLKRYVDKNQNDTLAMRQYADMSYAAHNPVEAEKYYDKVLKKDPKRIDMMFALSNVYYFNQEFEKTEAMTNRILSINPKNIEAQYNLGAVAATMGNDAKAKQIWQKIIAENPAHPMAEAAKQSIARLK